MDLSALSCLASWHQEERKSLRLVLSAFHPFSLSATEVLQFNAHFSDHVNATHLERSDSVLWRMWPYYNHFYIWVFRFFAHLGHRATSKIQLCFCWGVNRKNCTGPWKCPGILCDTWINSNCINVYVYVYRNEPCNVGFNANTSLVRKGWEI